MGELTGKHNVRIAFNAGTFSDGVETRLGVHVEKSPDNQQILTFQDVKSDGKEGLTQEEYNEIANALRKLEGFQEEWLSKINYINEQVTSKYGISPSTTGDDSTGEEDKQLEKFRKQYLEGGVTGTERRSAAFGKCMGSLIYDGVNGSLFRAFRKAECAESVNKVHLLAGRMQPFKNAPYSIAGADQEEMFKRFKSLPEAKRYTDVTFTLPEVAKNPRRFAALIRRIESSLNDNSSLQAEFRRVAARVVSINDSGEFPYDSTTKAGDNGDSTTIGYSEIQSFKKILDEVEVTRAKEESERTKKPVKPKIPPAGQAIVFAAEIIKNFCQIISAYAAAEEKLMKQFGGENDKGFDISRVGKEVLKSWQYKEGVIHLGFVWNTTPRKVTVYTYNKTNTPKWTKQTNKDDLSKLITLIEEDRVQYPSERNKQEVLTMLRIALDDLP